MRRFIWILLLSGPAAAQPVTSPAEHLGRPVGRDFELADWSEVAGYFRLLGRESPRVQTETIGVSTEGRKFLLSVISSEANLADLDRVRDQAAAIADPRGRSAEELDEAVTEGKVILFISCAMHATEAAAPQFAMEFAHRLATSEQEPWRSARDDLVVGIFPSLNPDGLDHVVEWYRMNVGTPFEASGLLKLYQLYTGHDNNRDWFMLTQAETRLVTDLLYRSWHPQVYWDVHQQGSGRERFFVPPFRDPLNPNLDASIISGIDVLGSRALLDMTREGLTGVSTGVSYDMWWNGGNRNVPVRHNIIGLLTEAASVKIATPVFLPPSSLEPPRGMKEYVPSNRFPKPWPGGWWRLHDIIDYELAFGRSLLASLSRERETWLRNALEAAQRVIRKGAEGAPRAWIIPSDNEDRGAVRRLLEVLMLSGVELHATPEPITADGRTYPAGSIVIRRDQPYGSHVKDLFEIQRYPKGQPPYDVAGWTLPLLMGVRRVEVMSALDDETPLVPVTDFKAATASFGADPRSGDGARPARDSDSWLEVVRWLNRREPVALLPAGDREGLFLFRQAAADAGDEAIQLSGPPRIGVYSPWRGNMDEGWMRYVLEYFTIPYVTVRNEMLRAGDLGDFLDVLVIPHSSPSGLDRGRPPGSVPEQYTRGLAPEGAVAVWEFVHGGGTLVTVGASSRWAVDLFELPLVDTTRGEQAGDFSCPGSVLRGVTATEHPVTAGLPASMALFFSRGCGAWRPMTEEELEEAELEAREIDVLLRYAPTRVLLSGWISGPEMIAGHGAWLTTRHGDGRVHLFGFRPQYRAWSQATFHLLFRSLLLPVPEPAAEAEAAE